MRFGIFYIPFQNYGKSATEIYETLLEEAAVADQLGWDSVWLAEHHFDEYGGIVPAPPLLGAALAMRTRRIRIGSAVAILPLHHSLRLAEELAMLDALSGGRVEVGVGRGFMPHEFHSFGVSLDARQGLFDEGLAVLLAAWTGEPFSFHGEHYNIWNAELYPKPVQKVPPLWMAASTSQQSFETAGRLGCNLMLNPYTRTADELGLGLRWYRDALAQAGHDARSRRIMVHQHLYVAPTEEQAREQPRTALMYYIQAVDRAYARGQAGSKPIAPTSFETMYPDRVMFGTPDIVRRKVQAWGELGVTDFCFMTQFGDISPDQSLASLRLFSEQVIPHFR